MRCKLPLTELLNANFEMMLKRDLLRRAPFPTQGMRMLIAPGSSVLTTGNFSEHFGRFYIVRQTREYLCTTRVGEEIGINGRDHGPGKVSP